jgi:tetratricopeptide (TPR) repeat protein
MVETCRIEHDAIADRLGQPMLKWVSGYLAAARAFIRGDLDEAAVLTEAAAELGNASGQPDAGLFHFGQSGHIQFLTGEGGQTREIWQAFADLAPHLAAVRLTVAWAYSELDDLDKARETIEPLFPDGVMTAHMDMLWTQTAAMSARVLHRLRWREAALSVYEQLSPYDGQLDFSGVNSLGAISEALALLAVTIGDDHVARRHFAAALDTYQHVEAAYFLARTQIEYGQWLVAQASDGDQSQGRRLIETGRSCAEARGYELLRRLAQPS